jgi:hypothetical protein
MPGWNFVTTKDFLIISSAAHLGLVLFADVRRHTATGLGTLVLWLTNQVARWAPTAALGKLSVGSTAEQEQLRTLWVAFMLLHAGMPDNITAYALEDTVMSMRQVVSVFLQLIGPVSPFAILYKNIFSSNDDPMLWVSSVICLMAIARYLEGALWALWLGNLENMRSFSKEEEAKSRPRRRSSLQSAMRGGSTPDDDDEQILLIAHDTFYITKNAFIDYLDMNNDDDAGRQQEALPATWDDMLYKVVTMELSLMYDIIYTKTTIVHTCFGYAIRFLSPIAGAAAFLLYWFHSKEGQAHGEVVITYAILAGTFILDINWLLRAVASTWTYSFLNDRPRHWLHHALLCSGKWRVIRGVIVSFNLVRFIANKEPISYRMWSGTIGQYNLLRGCTRDDDAGETTSTCVSYMLKKVSENKYLGFSTSHWMEYEYHYLMGEDISTGVIKEPLFRCIWEQIRFAFPKLEPNVLTVPPQAALPGTHFNQEINLALDFTPDLQETILILHIATDLILSWLEQDLTEASSQQQVQAMKALSNYMMFLVAVRPSMLPGLILSSLYDSVRDALTIIWKDNKNNPDFSRGSTPPSRETCLANILFYLELDPQQARSGRTTDLYNKSNILSEGTKLAIFLLSMKLEQFHHMRIRIDITLRRKFYRQFPDLMRWVEEHDGPTPNALMPTEVVTDAIFRAWVRQLINVSTRCSRDCHAKQLARGGELTTVVWILVEHARVLRVRRSTE